MKNAFTEAQMKLLNATNPEVIDKIRLAAKKQQVLSIKYRDSKGEVTTREGEPYEIKNGGLYMHCYMRDNIRFFKLDHIIEATVTSRKFTPRWPIQIS